MGADLLISKLRKQCPDGPGYSLDNVKKGYFRDFYTEGGLFSFVKCNTSHTTLSWWELQSRKEWFNKQHNMTVEGARQFLGIIKDVKDQIYSQNEWYIYQYDSKNQNNRRVILSFADVAEYKNWLECLIIFLELAIEKKSSIIWSV